MTKYLNQKLFRKLIIPAATILATSHGANAEQTLKISAGIYESGYLSQSRMDKTVKRVSSIFKNACMDVQARSSGLDVYASALGDDFDSSQERKNWKFKSSPFTIHVVRTISYCGGPSVKGNILGCAFQSGPVVVRKRASYQADAQIWAHELGHSQGLNSSFFGYVKGHNPNFGQLMFASASTSNVGLDARECNVMRKPQKSSTDATPVSGTSQGQVLEREQLQAYFSSDWFHGIDPALVDANAEGLAALASTALSEDRYQQWPNATLLAGYLAIPNALELLDKVILFENAEVSDEDAFYIDEAKPNAVLALGYLVVQADVATEGRISSRLNPNAVADPMLRGNLDDLQAQQKAIARSANIALALAASKFKPAMDQLQNQRQAQEKGAFDLGVSDQFFSDLVDFSSTVQTQGLGAALDDNPG